MLRWFPAAMIARAAALLLNGPASPASDITIAAIAAGRLCVVGVTGHPHTAVALDGRFDTKSDDQGKFQFELIYQPATRIVAATIEGTIHEAVVGNCAQQVLPAAWLGPQTVTNTPALLSRLMTPRVDSASASFHRSGSPILAQDLSQVEASVPAPTVFTIVVWAKLLEQPEAVSANQAGTRAEAVTTMSLPQVIARPATAMAVEPAQQLWPSAIMQTKAALTLVQR